MAYIVTYDGNGATSGSVPVDSTEYTSTGTVVVLDNTGSLALSGNTFSGWNTAANGSGTPYTAGSSFSITANTTLYAVWSPMYSVTYNGNGNTSGDVPVDSSTYQSGATVTVLGNTGSLVKTGNIFNGWNTVADGSGTVYTESSTFAITSNTVLFAQWVQVFTVVYDGNGNDSGSVPVDSNTYVNNSTVTISDNTGALVKAGFIFSGWNTAADGSGTGYSALATLSITQNYTLYAQWVHTYTVSYDGNNNDGGTVPQDTNIYVQNSEVTVASNSGELSRAGYAFIGWNTTSDGLGTSYAAGSKFNISANTTLYAVWALTYTVVYDINNGETGTVPIDANKYLNGAVVTVLGNIGSIARQGFDFVGWCKSSDGTGIVYSANQTFSIESSNVTLYAIWVTHHITYNGNSNTSGAVPVDTTNYSSTSSVVLLGNVGNLKKSGYVFGGWSRSLNGALITESTITITSDTTLYAVWTESTTSKIYTVKDTIVEASLIGSNIVKCSESLSNIKTKLNLHNTSVTEGLSGESYLSTSNISSDVFNQVTSTGIYVKGSNSIVCLSGYIDISCTTLNGHLIVDLHDTQSNPDHYYLVNTIVAYTTAGTYRLPISSVRIKVSDNTQFNFVITAESGSDIAVLETSLITFTQS